MQAVLQDIITVLAVLAKDFVMFLQFTCSCMKCNQQKLEVLTSHTLNVQYRNNTLHGVPLIGSYAYETRYFC